MEFRFGGNLLEGTVNFHGGQIPSSRLEDPFAFLGLFVHIVSVGAVTEFLMVEFEGEGY